MSNSGPYSVQLFNDLHTYFPAILYDPDRFTTTDRLTNYIQTQVRDHTNIFSMNYQQFQQQQQQQQNTIHPTPPIVQRRQPIFTTETIELTSPLYMPPSTEEPSLTTRINNSLATLNNSILMNEILRIFQTPSRNTIPTAGYQEPVIVRPTLPQIETATSLRIALEADEASDSACSICQDSYTEGQAIRSILRCNHKFHKTCIDTWFERNVRCPVCRYDIRDHT